MSEKQKPITREEIEANMDKIDEMLGIDKGDYQPLSPAEVKIRIAQRILEQDTIIYPERLKEGKVTREWQNYMRKRMDADKV